MVTNLLLVPPGIGRNPLLEGFSLRTPQPRPITGKLILRIWDVEHGACAMLHHLQNGIAGRLAMIDLGDTADWSPSAFIRNVLNRTTLDYLFITNADQDHMSDLQGLWDRGINVPVWHRNPSISPEIFRKIKEQSGPLTAVHAVSTRSHWHEGGCQLNRLTNTWGVARRACSGILTHILRRQNDLSLVVFIKSRDSPSCFLVTLKKLVGWRF